MRVTSKFDEFSGSGTFHDILVLSKIWILRSTYSSLYLGTVLSAVHLKCQVSKEKKEKDYYANIESKRRRLPYKQVLWRKTKNIYCVFCFPQFSRKIFVIIIMLFPSDTEGFLMPICNNILWQIFTTVMRFRIATYMITFLIFTQSVNGGSVATADHDNTHKILIFDINQYYY